MNKQRGRPGRPATGQDPFVGLRLPLFLIETIDAIAEFNKSSRSEVMRAALIKGLAPLLMPLLKKSGKSQGGAENLFSEILVEDHVLIEDLAALLKVGDVEGVLRAMGNDNDPAHADAVRDIERLFDRLERESSSRKRRKAKST